MSGSMVERFPEDIRKKAETVWAETIWLSARAENPINAIAQALLDERERAARIAINRADRHAERCDPECKCANGWHIAIAIRSPDTEKTL